MVADWTAALDGLATLPDVGDALVGYWGLSLATQYGMALLVRSGIELQRESIRTFGEFRWKDMPDALRPPGVGLDREHWYPEEAWLQMPLSARNHVDVPIRLPKQTVSRC